MITFTRLTYANFLSVGNSEISIDLNSTRSTLVVGHNGAGKSLMLDALSFALFGKPHRNINKPQLVNSINGKNCLVTVEFKIGPVEYKIIRGLKPNIFEIWQNNILINQESHSRDYQKLLETNILKLNHKSFHQVVVLGSSNFIPFMQLPAHARREVIEDLLDIGIFSKMNGVLKESSSKLRDALKDTDYQLNSIKEKIELQDKHIDSLHAISEKNVVKYEEEISDLRAQIDQMLAENTEYSREYNESFGKTQSKVQRQEKTKTTLLSYERQIKDNIKRVVGDSKFYEENTSCPTCNQMIDEDIRSKKLHDCKEQAKTLDSGYSQLKTTLQEASDELSSTLVELQRLQQLNNKISTNQSCIHNYEKRISDLQTLMNKSKESVDLEGAHSILESLHRDKDSLNELKATQLDERTYNEVISELLKDTGIKTKVIRQYLPIMNKLINQYLQILDFFVSFNLDENFNETIRSRHRDDFSYSSFSEGEKSRIDLSLLFSWRQIAKMKNSSNTNLLILDEVFDSSLDSDGVDNLLKIMATLDSDTRIFIISHKQDVLEGKFDQKIEFEKQKNFTAIKEKS
jgi:DNA repair exonuclease SbcCD ATPase subunit